MELRLDGGVAIVTGAGAGIGRASAETLARAGAAVLVSDRDAATASQVAKEIVAAGGKAHGVACDVTQEAALQSLVATAIERFGKITILVNNAG
jgi:7-alpha-hydroxysteroid dehydrogenase